MSNKTRATCIENDNGLCDRKGILIEEDDSCDKHRQDWRQQMMRGNSIGGNRMRYTEYHAGVAVIKDKALLKEAMQKLAVLEDLEEQKRLLVVEYNLSKNRRTEE